MAPDTYRAPEPSALAARKRHASGGSVRRGFITLVRQSAGASVLGQQQTFVAGGTLL
jgi:hypothetical protein